MSFAQAADMTGRDSMEPVALLPIQERDEDDRKTEASDLDDDIEAFAGQPTPVPAPKGENLDHEYSISNSVKFAWLAGYFVLSLGLTIYNKLVLSKVSLFLQLSSLSRRPLAMERHITGRCCSATPNRYEYTSC
jgi:hypothetical protein